MLAMLFVAVSVVAQKDEWEALMQEMAEDAGVEEGDLDSWLQAEELTDLHDHPIDLNSATRDLLGRLPFLDASQVEAILDYRALHGPFRSVGELRLIRGLDIRLCRWLRQFVIVVPAAEEQRRVPRYRHELMVRTDVPLYEREGWSWARGIAARTRYTAQLGRHWDVGIRGERDAGEPAFNRDNPLWDAWGGHVMLKDVGCLRTAIVGDFKASFGEGLVINNGFNFSKQLTSLWRTPNTLRPHRSADETHFLRGAAATLDCGRGWSLTALYSYRKLDATVQKDNTVQSINTSGLHRTESELQRRGTLGSQTVALHAAWQRRTWRLGATGMYQYFNRQFRQSTQLYRQIYPEGYQFGNVAADYGWRIASFYFSGETAHSFDTRGGGWATLNKAAWRFSPNTQVTAVQRWYAKHYYSPHASAFSENSTLQNESGLCLLFDAERLGPLALQALFDYFYSPWPRYTMTHYSTGCEAALQTTWQLNPRHTLLMRYSLKSKEKSDSRYYSHRLRTSYTAQLTHTWSAGAALFYHHYAVPRDDKRANGIAFIPRTDLTSVGGQLRWSLMAMLFRTGFGAPDDYASAAYDSRLYFYEPSLTSTFGLQSLYGRGERVATTLRWQNATHRLHLQAKVGVTHYRDRDVISSGVLLIDSPWKVDVQLLVRWRL